MKLAAVVTIAVASPAFADGREIGLEMGPAYHRAVDIDFYGPELAATIGGSSFGARFALGASFAPTRMDYNNSSSGRLSCGSLSGGVYGQLRPLARLRLIGGTAVGFHIEEWPSDDGNYVDSALLLSLGVHAGFAVDLADVGGHMLWIGGFGDVDWRPLHIGNHIKDQDTAVSASAIVGVRL
jgi:hypothetical protein